MQHDVSLAPCRGIWVSYLDAESCACPGVNTRPSACCGNHERDHVRGVVDVVPVASDHMRLTATHSVSTVRFVASITLLKARVSICHV
jgi:hypothetical protein